MHISSLIIQEGFIFEELILIILLGSYNCLYLRCGNTILYVVWKNKQKNLKKLKFRNSLVLVILSPQAYLICLK